MALPCPGGRDAHPWRCPRNSWMGHSELWAGTRCGSGTAGTLLLEFFPASGVLGFCDTSDPEPRAGQEPGMARFLGNCDVRKPGHAPTWISTPPCQKGLDKEQSIRCDRSPSAEIEELTNARCGCESQHTPAALVKPKLLKISKRTERTHSWGR